MKTWKEKIKWMRAWLSGHSVIYARLNGIEDRIIDLQMAIGRQEMRTLEKIPVSRLVDAEFRVFSQGGQDGIIQFLIRHVPIPRKIFIEFGAADYLQANTPFLLRNNNWAGLIIDGSESNMQSIRGSPWYWMYNLKATCSFVTRENINQLFSSNGLGGDIGLLSVDIDGNDYWVWKEISVISPRIVIVEYNARFGASRAVTIPYDPAFYRTRAHFSNVYFGASLAALVKLGKAKGYDFVGCNSLGNDAFFIRSDVRPKEIPTLTAEQGFVELQSRESRDEKGCNTFLDRQGELKILDTLPVVEV